MYKYPQTSLTTSELTGIRSHCLYYNNAQFISYFVNSNTFHYIFDTGKSNFNS